MNFDLNFLSRFYGRVALEPGDHEPQTLVAIKENGCGLASISGERIWMELKKLAVGNHADHLLELIYSLDLAQYMGEGEGGALPLLKCTLKNLNNKTPTPFLPHL